MFILKIGQKITPTKLINQLANLEYEYNTEANEKGLYSFRGDVVDFWSPQFKYPLRADFDFDRIKEIYLFDEYHQRQIEAKEEVKILSARLPSRLKKTKKIDISFIASLVPGDLIVHLDHGIGQFLGLTFKAIEKIKREYIVLRYGGGDTLYLPVDLADKIDKYIGPKPGALHKLDRAVWEQIKSKTREDVAVFASELLEIYSQRSLSAVRGFSSNLNLEKQLADSFMYEETEDQKKAIKEVLADLAKSKPMDRLIAGDVGFGKTEVAVRAAFRVFLNKAQVALLCPTTILAQQHFDTFTERFNKIRQASKSDSCLPKIFSLSRFQSKNKQQDIVQKICSGEIDIVIATHRILSQDIKFKNLGLLVIDEEQKFGVAAKEKLKKIKPQIHVLTLSATPIPRSLNLSLTKLRDISLINTPPLGRLPVKTMVETYDSNLIKMAINNEIKRGGQVYYLFNKVYAMEIKKREIESLLGGLKNLENCPISVSIAHGQMPAKELAQTMHQFDQGKIDVLLCSTIIENGLDLPNVNTLIVEKAEDLGLSQAYQLRGRIGRGIKQAYAYFFYDDNKALLEHNSIMRCPANFDQVLEGKLLARNCQLDKKSKARERLEAIKDFTDLGSGFRIAMRDLEIRGAGAILGKKQHGPIGSVGLGLYLTILNEEVERLKGQLPAKGKYQENKEVNIDLPIEYGLPLAVEPNEAKRIELYHNLAKIKDLKELEREFKELFLRAASGDKSLKRLFDIFKIKILAKKLNIERIVYHYQRFPDIYQANNSCDNFKIIVKFRNQQFPASLLTLIDQNPFWQVGNETIKISDSDLGTDWILGLIASLEILSM